MQMWAVRVAAYAQPTKRPTRLTDLFCQPFFCIGQMLLVFLGAVDNDGDADGDGDDDSHRGTCGTVRKFRNGITA